MSDAGDNHESSGIKSHTSQKLEVTIVVPNGDDMLYTGIKLTEKPH